MRLIKLEVRSSGARHCANEVLPIIKRGLLNALATTLDQKKHHNDEERAGDYPDNCCIGHVHPPFHYLLSCVKDSVMMMIAGPSVTRKREGKMKNTRGKINLMVVFAACSSTF